MEEGELRQKVAEEIDLFEKARPEPTADIDLVWVFSGPGTAFEPWSKSDPEWMAWMDLSRIQRGLRLIFEVTGCRLQIPATSVDEVVLNQAGPRMLYNGVDSKGENRAFEHYIKHTPLSYDRTIVINNVNEGGVEREIKNTRDQIVSLKGSSIWSEVTGAVALVSTAAHLPRILRYIDMYR